VPGQTFVIFDVSDITPLGNRTAGRVRNGRHHLVRRDQGAKAAKAAADRIDARVRQGSTLAARSPPSSARFPRRRRQT
jgi:peptidyl-prolyl cis-trans isomerase D